MPSSMVKTRCEILQWLAKTDNISQISRETGHNRVLIRKIKAQLDHQEDIFEMPNKLSAPIKVTTDIQNEVQSLTMANRRMTSLSIANIIS